MHHRFDDVACATAHFDDPDRDERQHPAELVEAQDPPRGGTVADIGAGTGYPTRTWQRRSVERAG